jgi:peroxiredoxin Q/BCP
VSVLTPARLGCRAPDFTLDGTHGRFVLSAHRGSPVLLLFYPRDGGAVCTRQFRSFAREREALAALRATVVGISPDSVASHHRFGMRLGLSAPLLADVGGAVASLYGAATRRGRTHRALVLIDGAGKLRHRHIRPLGLTFEHVEEMRCVLEGLELCGT